MNNLSSYCGLVDAKIRASDKDLSVKALLTQVKPTKVTPMLSEKDKLRFLFKFLADWMLASVPNAC